MKKAIFVILLLAVAAGVAFAWKTGKLERFGIGGTKPVSPAVVQKPKTPPATQPAKVAVPALPDVGSSRAGSTPAVVAPRPVPPVAPPPAAPTPAERLRAAEADLATTKAGIERAKADAMARLVTTTVYAAAKAEADQSETAVKAVRARSDGPSAELTSASQRWIDAKGRLARMARETLDKDPAILASIKAVKDKTAALEKLRPQIAAEERAAALTSAAQASQASAQQAERDRQARAAAAAAASSARPAPVSGATAEGFAYRNLALRSGVFSEDLVGDITNNTGRDYAVACFTVSLLDASGRAIESAPVNIETFKAGETRSFTAYTQADASRVKKIVVKLQTGF